MRKKKVLIIVLWLICSFLTSMFLMLAETLIFIHKEKYELAEQSETIAAQIPVLLEYDFFYGYDSVRMKNCRMNAVSMVLENADNLEEVKGELSEIAETESIENLSIYDLNGKELFTAGDGPSLEHDPETVIRLSEYDYSEAMNLLKDDMDLYRKICFTEAAVNEAEDIISWFRKAGKWIVCMNFRLTEEENDIMNYFRWDNLIQKIRIGSTGFVMAIDETSGTVLSGTDPGTKTNYAGKKIDELGVRENYLTPIADINQLKAAFDRTDKINVLDIGNGKYLAHHVKTDDVFVMVLIPYSEINNEVMGALNTCFFVVFLLMGICMLYCFFHLEEDGVKTKKGRRIWNASLAAKLRAITLLGLGVTIIIGILFKAMAFSAQVYRYNIKKAEEATELYDEHKQITEKLKDWLKQDYLERCQIAGTIIRYTDEEDLTKDFLEELSESLDAKDIYIFDSDGKLVLSDSPYENQTIDPDSPFYPLINQYPTVAEDLEYDEGSDSYRQTVGVSLIDDEGICTGLVILESDAIEIDNILNNLGYKGLYTQIGMINGTAFMVVDAETLNVKYSARMNGKKIVPIADTSDGKPLHITDLGIDEKKIREDYSGILAINNMGYFSIVRKAGEDYFIFLRNQVEYDLANVISIIVQALAFLFFMFMLIRISCSLSEKDVISGDAEESSKEETEEKESAEEHAEEGTKPEGVLTFLATIANKEKPYFEDRWGNDTIKWKDKNPTEKFTSALNYVVVFALIFVFFQAMTLRENSAWYFCFTGDWGKGVNIGSLSTCILSISTLYICRIVLHKILFFIARAADSKGETICNLLDSFSAYILFIVGVLWCLVNIGVDIKTLSLTGGVAGVIFGIGCQNIVADILAGILMCFEGVVHAGDFVMFNGNPGVVLSIGVRTTRLKWFGQITVVRNNEFKNYVNYLSDKKDRTTTTLTIDIHESLERVEAVLQKELPLINKRLNELCADEVRGPSYRGLSEINENGMVLSFGFYVRSMYSRWLLRNVNRELKMMCERNNIRIAMHQVIINEPAEYGTFEEADSEQDADRNEDKDSK